MNASESRSVKKINFGQISEFLYPLAFLCASALFLLNAADVATFIRRITSIDRITPASIDATFTVFCFVFAGLFVTKLGNFLLWDILLFRSSGFRIPKLLKQILNSMVMFVAIAASLNVVLGLKISDVITTSGFISLILGFAVRPILTDLFSGVALNLEHSFSLEEYVMIRQKGMSTPSIGCVKEITWRTTRILTNENHLLTIPNSEIISATVLNFSRPSPISEFEIEICLDFSADLNLAQNVIDAALCEAVSATYGPCADSFPKARIVNIDAIGVHFKITFAVDPAKSSKGKARHVIYCCISNHLRFSGLSPAANKQEISLGKIPLNRSYDYNSVIHKKVIMKQVELFTSLENDELQLLAEQIEIRHYIAKENVIVFGDSGESMFVVVVGFLDVSIKVNDKQIQVATLRPGHFFGEMSLLTGEDRSATVQADVPSILYEIKKSTIGLLLQKRVELMHTLSEVAATRRMENMQFVDASIEKIKQQKEGLISQISQGIRAFFGF